MEIQPALESSRKEITDALKAVEKLLKPEQWQRVPDEVKSPFQRGRAGRRAE